MSRLRSLLLFSTALLKLSAVASGQVSISAAPEGSEVLKAYLGRNVSGLTVWSISVCSAKDEEFAGLLHASIMNGVVLMTSSSVDALQSRLAARSPSQFVADAGEGLTLLGTGLIASKVISAGSVYISSGLMLAAALHWASGKLAAKVPDPARLRAIAIPPAVISVRAGGCVNLEALGSWTPQSKPFTAVIQ